MRNPNHNKFKKPEDYKDIGWQISASNPTVDECFKKGHSYKTGELREFDNSMNLYRGTNVITICDECKYIFHTDMSD